MSLKITKFDVNASQQKSLWDFGNGILYDMCAIYPAHKSVDQIVAKIWLIGRSYAAAIERRKNAKESNEYSILKWLAQQLGNLELMIGLNHWKGIGFLLSTT